MEDNCNHSGKLTFFSLLLLSSCLQIKQNTEIRIKLLLYKPDCESRDLISLTTSTVNQMESYKNKVTSHLQWLISSSSQFL